MGLLMSGLNFMKLSMMKRYSLKTLNNDQLIVQCKIGNSGKGRHYRYSMQNFELAGYIKYDLPLKLEFPYLNSDYNFSVNLLANEIFAASFPYAEHVDNISSYQTVNGANKIRSEDSEKNGNF